MTNKPIMIDDVDVTECENLYTTNLPIGNDKIKCGLHQGIGKTCNDYPNCYFKQLKRKEQKCEQLRETIKLQNEMQKEVCEEKNKQIDQLKTELEPFRDEYFKGLDNITISELAKKSIRITAENCKLEQALQEIKEIADKNEFCPYVISHRCIKNECKRKDHCEIAKILQKCEVLDEK